MTSIKKTKPESKTVVKLPASKKTATQKVLTADDIFESYRQGWIKHSPGWYAILTHDNKELARLLQQNAPKIIQENNTVSDLLGLALSFKNYEAANMLLKNNNAKNFKNAMGVGATHMAAKEIKTQEEYEKAKNWLLNNGYDLGESYEYNKETYTFESIARKSMSVPPITWVSDYNQLFEKKPQWVKDKEEKMEKEKKETAQKALEDSKILGNQKNSIKPPETSAPRKKKKPK